MELREQEHMERFQLILRPYVKSGCGRDFGPSPASAVRSKGYIIRDYVNYERKNKKWRKNFYVNYITLTRLVWPANQPAKKWENIQTCEYSYILFINASISTLREFETTR